MGDSDNRNGNGQAGWVELTDYMPDAVGGVDPTTCPIQEDLNGNYGNGAVEIKPGTTGPNGETGGDVYVNGSLVYDCPGYEA